MTAYTEPVQTAPTQSQHSAASADPGTVDPNWTPPEDPAKTGAPLHVSPSRRQPCSDASLSLALCCGCDLGFGGFKKRTHLQKSTPPGTLITSGPYEFRFTEATAQHKKDFGGAPYWEVVIIGEGRTTGTESSSPKYFGADSMFVSKDDGTEQVVVSESVRMGAGRSYDRHQFTPGLPLSAYAVVFKYADNYRPGPTIRFGVSELVYGTQLPHQR